MNTAYIVRPGWKDVTIILWTACIVAVADGLAAVALTFFLNHRPPIIVFQFIASGLLGPASFSGGIATALLGVLLHFLIALIWCTFFFVIHKRLWRMVPSRILRSVIYGILIWTAMNLIVLPLSQVPLGPRDVSGVLTGMTALILAAGIPMAYVFDRHFRRPA